MSKKTNRQVSHLKALQPKAEQPKAETESATQVAATQMDNKDVVNHVWFNSCSGVLEGGKPIILTPLMIDEKLAQIPSACFGATGFSRPEKDGELYLFYPGNSASVPHTTLIVAAYSSYLMAAEKMDPNTAFVVSLSEFIRCGAIPQMRLFRAPFIKYPDGEEVPIHIVIEDSEVDAEKATFKCDTPPSAVLEALISNYEKKIGRPLTTKEHIQMASDNQHMYGSLF